MPEGSTLDYAQCLEDGLQLVERESYDLILTDLRMPGTVNGDALTATLERCPDAAVMVITALHFPAYAASLIRQGAVWVSFKPDAALEPEIAERLLQEAMLFAVARHESERSRAMNASVQAAEIAALQREVRELRSAKEHLIIIDTRYQQHQEDIQALETQVDRLNAQLSGRAVEREKGKWGLWGRVLGVIGTGLAAILGAWASGRWGKP